MSQPVPLIETDHLVKRFGEKIAVDDVSFQVFRGEIFGFLGPNGAGKTTTLKMLVGLLRPTSGAVRMAGYDVVQQPLQAKASCGYVPDEPNLYAKLTGRELLRFVGDLYGLDPVQAGHRSEELLRLFGLAEAANDTIDSYSHGMKQKTSLAAALVHDPRVLMLDEPTVGLDPKSARLIKDILRQMADRGAAVMLITHDMGVIAETCDRVAVMYAGRIAECGPVHEVINQPAHPYSMGLMAAIPDITQDRERLHQIDGAMPRLNAIPPGCAYNPRCPRAFARCLVERPELLDAGATRAACWLHDAHGSATA
jgi:peptide/nickel transport system ATP-binding protein